MTDKTAAELRQAERDSIKVEVTKKDDDGNVIEAKKVETKEPETADDSDTEAEVTKEGTEEAKAEAETAIEAAEKTEEELEAEFGV